MTNRSRPVRSPEAQAARRAAKKARRAKAKTAEPLHRVSSGKTAKRARQDQRKLDTWWAQHRGAEPATITRATIGE